MVLKKIRAKSKIAKREATQWFYRTQTDFKSYFYQGNDFVDFMLNVRIVVPGTLTAQRYIHNILQP